MDHHRLGGIFSRRKRSPPTNEKGAMIGDSIIGAHELFLEQEGFLPTERPASYSNYSRPRRGASMSTHIHDDINSSQESGQTSRPHHRHQPHKSLSSLSTFSEAAAAILPAPKRKRRIISMGKSMDEVPYEKSPHEDNLSRDTRSNLQRDVRAPTWLQRCIGVRTHGRPATPSTPLSPCNESPSETGQLPAPVFEFGVVPGFGTEPPSPFADLSSGAAARAAAAAQNEILTAMRNMNLDELRINKDSESGVGIEVRDCEGDSAIADVPVVRQDPVHLLPPEIMWHVFSYLDSQSLLRAECISRSWHEIASSHHAWKQIYRADFDEPSRHLRPSQCKMSRRQDWKAMWKTHKALDKRWTDGHAAAIYLEGHTDSVYCVQFDVDKILTGSRDRTVRVWDMHTYECIKVLGTSAPNRLTSAPALPIDAPEFGLRPFTKVFSPHTIASLPESRRLIGHSGSILCLQYDNDILVTGSSDESLIVWDVRDDYRPIRRLSGHTSGVLDVCFDERCIISCSKDATVKLWDRSTGHTLRTLTGHRGPVNAVQLRGNLVVSASGDGIAKLWNLTSGLCIKEFRSRDRGMACVEFSPDSRTILAGGNDQVIYQFDTNSGELVRELKGHEALVRSLHLDSSSGRVVSGSYDNSVKAFDLKTGEPVVNFKKWTSSWILSAKADYRRIIATSQDSRAVIMDFGYHLPGIAALES